LAESQLRSLPSVDSVMATETVAGIASVYRREWVLHLVRQELDRARQAVRQGGAAPPAAEVAAQVCRRIQVMLQVQPRPVINATGVVIHTNLGRAPLSRAAIQAMAQAAQGYANLEMDLESGRRGSRQAHLQPLLGQLTGAEAALAVNNNASAVLLGLSALAAGKEVIVSRGEAVEIGGGFRIPDVLRQSGCILVDVGTTNRTYIRDYESAVTGNTGALLKVHASNFRVEGFTASVEASELVELGQRLGVAVLHDVGSGCLLPTEKYGLAHEPMPQESVAAGMGLVFFSGDKLLGGPQAGIVVGKKDLVARLERHPLARAVRIDKMSLAALTATLAQYLRGEAELEIPVWRMIAATEGALKDRARRWQAQLGRDTHVESSRSAIGGGSLPGETLPTWVLALATTGIPGGTEGVMQRLRQGSPPVVGRIGEDRVLLDPRTVLPEEDESLMAAVRGALA
jgi:L-seryl-tRNA(Ser) seleniumtransferase